MIYFDLDCVLRDLISAIGVGYNPQTWEECAPDGTSIFEYINNHKYILFFALPLEYLAVANLFEYPRITTHQELDWIPYTKLWIKKYLPRARVTYVQHPFEKLDILGDNDVLVEDYPYFPDNSKIIMVDRPYNMMTKGCLARVGNVDELGEILGL
jgi:hypothetical protein